MGWEAAPALPGLCAAAMAAHDSAAQLSCYGWFDAVTGCSARAALVYVAVMAEDEAEAVSWRCCIVMAVMVVMGAAAWGVARPGPPADVTLMP